MSSFTEFAEIMERDCFAGWRSIIGRENDFIIEDIDSVVFSMKDNDVSWDFSFALRYKGKWAQGKVSVAPIEYDIFASNEHGENRSPDNIASDLSLSLLMDAVGRI